MSKNTKIWLIIAVSLITLGIILFAGLMTMLKFDFKKLSTTKKQTNSYAITEVFSGITINTNTADVNFIESSDGSVSVTCFEEEKEKHNVLVVDGVLVIQINDTRKWFDYISLFNFKKPKITVSIPKGEYGALVINASTGDISVPNAFKFESAFVEVSTGDVDFSSSTMGLLKISGSTSEVNIFDLTADEIDVSVSTGEIDVTNVTCNKNINLKVSTGDSEIKKVTCGNLTTTGSTGDIELEEVIIREKLSIQRSTGDVDFSGCDAGEVSIETDTGDVEGSFVTENIIFATSNTGKVKVPESTAGGKCVIKTDTGRIIITFKS